MPSRIRVVVLVGVLVVALVGCGAPEPAASPAAPSPAASSPASGATPTGDPDAGAVTVTLDAIETAGATWGYDDPTALVAHLQERVGAAPTVSDIPDPWGNGTSMGTRYEWEGIGVSDLGGRASVWVRGASAGALGLQTAEGLRIGDDRAAAVAAGAFDVFDEDGDGVANALGVGARVVAGTTSLVNPGQPGIEYVLLLLDGDVISGIQAPGNDFSDI